MSRRDMMDYQSKIAKEGVKEPKHLIQPTANELPDYDKITLPQIERLREKVNSIPCYLGQQDCKILFDEIERLNSILNDIYYNASGIRDVERIMLRWKSEED